MRNIVFVMALEPAMAKSSRIVLAIYALNCCLNAFGMMLSIGLIIITVRSRRLHNTCSLLIAFNALCTILLLTAIFIPFFVVLLPQIQSVPMLHCFLVQLVPNFGVFGVISMMPVIGMDRLLSAFFPLWYMQRNERRSLFVLIALGSSFSLLLISLIFQNVRRTPNAPLVCTLGELIGEDTSFVAGLCLSCNCLAIAFYSLVWAKLKWDIRKSASAETISSRQPVFKSLTIILAIQFGGWCIGEMAFVVVFSQAIASLEQWQLAASINIFICAVACTDPIVLFWTSEEYRKAFCEQFPWLSPIGHKISPSSTNQSTTQHRAAWNTSVIMRHSSVAPHENM